MKIGLATTDFERDFNNLPLKTLFEKMADFGYSCTQLSFGTIAECNFTPEGNFDIPPLLPKGLAEKITAAAQDAKIEISALNGTWNSAHPDDAVREEGLRRFGLLAEAAAEMGVPIITLCSGSRNESHMWRTHPDNNSEEAFCVMKDSMIKMAEIAEKLNLTLAIESEDSNIISTPEKARRVMGEVGSKRLKMIMDAANLFHPGDAKKENVQGILDHAFESFGKDIVIAHGKDIKESDGIDFCATGEGIVDFPHMLKLFEKYGFMGEMIIHGVYDENKMAGALKYMSDIL